MTSALLIALLMTAPVLSDPDSPDPALRSTPEATVAQGRVRGVAGEGVAAFQNLPYAAPPTGALRWRAPQPAAPWDGVRSADRPGAICVQPPSNGDPGVGPLPMSEDCLTLNVWRPTLDAAEPLPVMVWVHGGGFNNGSGTAALYDGAALARRGVVVVTVNYRLGRLGFFDHPALAAERAETEAAGNYGLMDLIAALEWVRDNIGAFGGDAGNVTVFGNSAGGAAVTRLMIAPPARGLFHRAVVQSGLGREQAPLLNRTDADGRPSTQARGAAFVDRLELVQPVTAEALRAVPAEVFLRPAPHFYGGDLTLIDGRIITEQVEAAFASGRQAPVPMIIGTNSKEFWWIRTTDPSAYGAVDDTLDAAERATLKAAYGGEAGFEADIVSDMIFNEPARHLARLHAAAGHAAYLYRFSVASAAMPEPHGGATHASERPYVFDNLQASSWPTEAMDQRAADVIAGAWTAFARSGDPTPDGAGWVWPAIRFDADDLADFTNDGPVIAPPPHGERLDLIEAHFARLRPSTAR